MSRNSSVEFTFTTPTPDPAVMPLQLLEPLPCILYQSLNPDVPLVHPLTQTPPPFVVQLSEEELKSLFSNNFSNPEPSTEISVDFFNAWKVDKGILHPSPEYGLLPDPTTYPLPYDECENPEFDGVKESKTCVAVQDYTQGYIANTPNIKTESYGISSTPLIIPRLDLGLSLDDSPSAISIFQGPSPVATKPKITKVVTKSVARPRSTAKRTRSSTRLHPGTPYPDTDATSFSGDSERDEQAPAKRIKRESSETPIKWFLQCANSRGYTPSLICYVNGCMHCSKTAHECCKHRDVHFPESKRFQCPGCQTSYTRASSLLRHLDTKDSGSRVSCRAAAGPRKTWGCNARAFEVRAPVWFQRGGVPQEEVEYWKAKWNSYK